MGYSTFIEINNDMTNEIAENPEKFMSNLLCVLHTGQNNFTNEVIRLKSVHREDVEYDAIIHELDF